MLVFEINSESIGKIETLRKIDTFRLLIKKFKNNVFLGDSESNQFRIESILNYEKLDFFEKKSTTLKLH
jgi:hypothetical protein